MILRGITARRLVSLTIFVLTALVVAGTTAAVGFARLADVSQGAVGMLVLLGFVALAAQIAESVRRREPELALARLRGRRGARLLLFAIAEPGLVILGGAVAGLGVGILAGRAAVDAWLPTEATYSLDRAVLGSAAGVTAGALLLVAATSWRVVRSPLLVQLAAARRPRRTPTTTLFLQVVLVLGAVVAIYQARKADSSSVDWVTLVSPAVVGLAAGQIVMWLVAGVLAVVVPRQPAIGVGWFLTLRRLLRRADSLALLRTVVAAGVVVGVAISAFTLADGWREQRARLQVGAPMSFPAPDGALRAYAAAHTADPEGRWLLPVAAVMDGQGGGSRRVLVDTERWQPVVGDFFPGSTGSELSRAFATLGTDRAVVYTRATTVSASVGAEGLTGRGGAQVVAVVQYVNDDGDLQVAELPLTGSGQKGASAPATRVSVPLPDCSFACSVAKVLLQGSFRGSLALHSLTFGDLELLSPSTGALLAPPLSGLRVQRDGTGVLVGRTGPDASGESVLATFEDPAARRTVTTSSTRLDARDGAPSLAGVDGQPRKAAVVGTVSVLPFAGRSGVAADLSTMLAGSGGNVVAVQAVVLARADTPTAVLDALRDTGSVRAATTYDATLARLEHQPRAEGTRLYVLMAILAGLVALVSILSSTAQQVRERRVEAASLRSVGIGATAIRAAYRREALVLAVAALLATAVAAWVSCWVLLRALPLVSGWAFAPPLDLMPSERIVFGAAVVAGLLVAGVTYGALRGVGRAAPPRLLREDAT